MAIIETLPSKPKAAYPIFDGYMLEAIAVNIITSISIDPNVKVKIYNIYFDKGS